MNEEGIVIETTGSWHKVQLTNGKLVQARLKGKFRLDNIKLTNPIAVGDRVKIGNAEEDNSIVIQEIFERKNKIIRQSPRKKRHYHIIASNIDQALIIASLKMPRTKTGFINRVLVGLEYYNITPIIVFNKVDLYRPQDIEKMNALREDFKKIGYQTILTSPKENIGFDELNAITANRTSVVTGPSGVGKSTITNWLHPELDVKTSKVSTYNEKGKHTTTYATMHALPNGGFLVDTPGIKEYGVAEIDAYELSFYFPEMKRLQENCKFNNCQHLNEPKCAVKKGLETGEVPKWRYDSYQTIREELLIENKHYL